MTKKLAAPYSFFHLCVHVRACVRVYPCTKHVILVFASEKWCALSGRKSFLCHVFVCEKVGVLCLYHYECGNVYPGRHVSLRVKNKYRSTQH